MNYAEKEKKKKVSVTSFDDNYVHWTLILRVILNEGNKSFVWAVAMTEQGPDILSHETKIAKSSIDQWRKYKHRRSAKCADNHKFANGTGCSYLLLSAW